LAGAGIVDHDGDGFFDYDYGTSTGNPNLDGWHTALVDMCIRIDDTPGRYEAGLRMRWELETNIKAYTGGIGFKIQEWDAAGSVAARNWWMAGKGAVIYTGGWS